MHGRPPCAPATVLLRLGRATPGVMFPTVILTCLNASLKLQPQPFQG